MLFFLLLFLISKNSFTYDTDCNELIENLKKTKPIHIVIYQDGINQSFSIEKPTQVGSIEIEENKKTPEITQKLENIEKIIGENRSSMIPILLTIIKPLAAGFVIGYYNVFIKKGIITSISLIKYIFNKVHELCTKPKES